MTRTTLLARRRASRERGDRGGDSRRQRAPVDRANERPGAQADAVEPELTQSEDVLSQSADASAWPRYLRMPAAPARDAPAADDGDAAPVEADTVDSTGAAAGSDSAEPASEAAAQSDSATEDPTRRTSPADAAQSVPADPSAARASSHNPPPALQGASAPAPIPAAAVVAEPLATATPLRQPSAAALTGREGSAQAVADEAREAQEAADDEQQTGAGQDGAQQESEEESGEEGQEEGEDEGDGDVAGDGPAGGGGATLGVIDEGSGDAEGEFPEALIAIEEQPLLVPVLERKSLDAPWQVPSDLPADALPPPRGAGNAAPAKPAPPAQAGDPAGAAPKPAPPPRPSEADAARRTDLEAQALARRAYADLAQSARREMNAFVDRANSVLASMADRYQRTGEAMLSAWHSDRDSLRLSVERACMEVEGAAAFALLQLDTASSNTAVAISQAGSSADALITAGETAAAGQIEQVVTSLVAGHLGAYNGAIGQADRAGNAAMLALNEFRDNRATRYPTSGAALSAAIHESLQARIPRWADREATNLNKRLDDKRKAWETSRDTSACSMSCGYRGSLTATHAQMVVEGRKAVTTALSGARSTLKQQTRDGRKTLSDQRRSLLSQARVQGRATESRLASQIRVALGAAQQEAQGALSSVHGAARGALPSYPRAVLGFDQALRKGAPRGAAALRQSAERGPDGAMQGLRRTAEGLDARLQGNREKLDNGLAGKVRQQHQQRAEQLTAHELTQAGQVTEGRSALEQSANGIVGAFQGLAGAVIQSAAQWAQPLETRMAGVIAEKRTEAATALTGLLTGAQPAAAAGPPPAAAAGPAAPGAASCSGCDTATGNAPAGNAPAGAAPAGGAAAGPQGLTAQVQTECDHYALRAAPETFFSERITETNTQVIDNLYDRAGRIAGRFEGGFAGTVDEEGAIAVLRGLTQLKGHALDVDVYRGLAGDTLDNHLYHYLNDDPDDLAACRAYLRGDAVEGARLELKNSTGRFNDDEARIEATMRALSPDQLAALGQTSPGVMSDVRDALGGTDRQVFDALAAGDHALADAHRMRDAVDEARRDRDSDATNAAIERYTGAPDPNDWRSSDAMQMSGDDRRTAVVAALGGIVSNEDVARGVAPGTDISRMSAEDRAVAYVTRSVDVYVQDGSGGYGEHGGGGRIVSERMTGANADLAAALLRHGSNSVEARASRLGVELQRRGEAPNPLNIDRATFSEGFSSDLSRASPEEREAHRHAAMERARVVMLAAQRYAGGETTPEGFTPGGPNAAQGDPTAAMSDTHVTAARERLISGLRDRFGSDTVGADLAAGLLTDARPSPDTAALAMRHAMYSRTGTNEELLFRFTERMNRDEVAQMRTAFTRQTGGMSLDAELGVYGEGGTFTELSGDDRLRMERAMLGVPRNDQERLETAAFALQQQRRETGGFGASLAEGTLADRVMGNTERRLEMLAGGPIALSRRGELTASLPVFDRSGRYTGPDRDSFRGITSVAQTVAQNYSARIDAFADVFTTGIAILGAIAAAVITVATGGAAGPLIAAAIITGLASMSANYAIKGGRYGWEQAGVDLAMTAVQAITAGVGAQLGAAAQVASKGAQAASQATRTLAALSRIFTGNPIVDQIIVGAITGGIGGLAGAAVNEQTWDSKNPLGGLFAGLLRGAAGGAATAALTNSIEALGRNGAAIAERAKAFAAQGGLMRGAVGLAGRGIGTVGVGINAAVNASTGGGVLRSGGAMLARGTARAVISGSGGMIGRGAELATDAALGRYKGDIGDALLEMGHAGIQAAIQGMGEGAAEAVGQGMHTRRITAAEASINRERASLGLEPPLHGDQLRSAAEDLMFLNQHGRLGRDDFAKAINMEHVATHGGMMPTVVERFPSPAVEEGMRSALLRHVPEAQRAALADVPIRVMPEAEFRAMTRSESGHAVTVMENGHPVVIVREGAPISQLSNEGPHLLQARESGTRDRVARLDEATMARWDSLDLDTQIDLFRNKIDLEIDAHERIAQSLAAEQPQGPDAVANHAADVERNEITLRNLRGLAEGAANITPEQRAAMDAGTMRRPQYLEQPARLFSKERQRGRATADDGIGSGTPEEQRTADILHTLLESIGEIRRTVPQGGLVDPDMQTLPDAPVKLPGERRTDVIDYDRSPRPPGFDGDARAQARAEFGRLLQDMLLGGHGTPMTAASRDRLELHHLIYVMNTGRLPPGVEFHHLLAVADYPEFAHRPDVGLALAKWVHAEAGHAMNSRRPLEAATLLDPDAETRTQGFHNDPEANKGNRAKHAEIGDGTRSTGDVDRDIMIDMRQRVAEAERRLAFAERRAARPQANDADRARVETAQRAVDQAMAERAAVLRTMAQNGQRRDALMRHVPEDQRAQFADVRIREMPEAAYDLMTQSKSGPAVTIIENGQPVVVVRRGTPAARLADEGPHLMQSVDPATRAAMNRLDEGTMRRWNSLDLDTQIELYRTKIGLEIDAHERIARSLAAEAADTPEAAARKAADLERNETTLRNLRARAGEVEAITPEGRAAMRSDPSKRPQYLDQPARLFSKGPRQPVVFEPFVGPDLQSPAELQKRYPGASVIAGEMKNVPDAAAIHAFHQAGGDFMQTRFGESLPDNHVDTMHVRFPMPHDKQVLVMPEMRGKSPAEMMTALRAATAAHAEFETLINLAPTALRKLAPGGRLEVVYDEIDIHHELRRVADLRWTDPADGKHYRLEQDGPPHSEPRAAVAPHSGFGVSKRPEAFVVSFRKVEVADAAGTGGMRTGSQHSGQTQPSHGQTGTTTRRSTPGGDTQPHGTMSPAVIDHAHPVVSAQHTADADLRSSLLRHVPAEQRAQFADVEIRVLTDAEFHALTGSGSGHAVTVIENGKPVVIVREGAPLSHLADEGPHLMQAHDHATRAKVLRLDEATMRQWDSLDLDTQIELYQNKIALEIDAHEQIARSLAQENPDTPEAKALHAAEVERNEVTLRNLRNRHNEVADLTPERRTAIRTGDAKRPQYLDQPARLFGKKSKPVDYGSVPAGLHAKYASYLARKRGRNPLSADAWYKKTRAYWLSSATERIAPIKSMLPHDIKAQRVILGFNEMVAVIGRSMGDLRNPTRGGEAGVVDFARFLRSQGVNTELFAGAKIKPEWFAEIEALRVVHGVDILPDHIIHGTEFYRQNVAWANELIAKGYTVIDIGNPNRRSELGPFYSGEIDATFGSAHPDIIIDWSADNAYPP